MNMLACRRQFVIHDISSYAPPRSRPRPNLPLDNNDEPGKFQSLASPFRGPRLIDRHGWFATALVVTSILYYLF